jgi:hypothetical protein
VNKSTWKVSQRTNDFLILEPADLEYFSRTTIFIHATLGWFQYTNLGLGPTARNAGQLFGPLAIIKTHQLTGLF